MNETASPPPSISGPRCTPADLLVFMNQKGIPGEIIYLSSPTPTVERAAAAVGAIPDQIVKSILFLVDDQPVLAITCGLAHIDRRAIAARYQVGRKRVKLAPAEVVLRVSGYEVGAMPPFGHMQPLPTLIDPHVLDFPFVYGGGGAENALLRVASQEIVRASQALIVPLQSADADPAGGDDLNPPEGIR